MISALVVLCAVILDTWFGKPGWWDPLGGFERLVEGLTRGLRPDREDGGDLRESPAREAGKTPAGQSVPGISPDGCASLANNAATRKGLLALSLVLAVCLPPSAILYLVSQPPVRFVIELIALYLALGGHRLIADARNVFGRLLDEAASRVRGRGTRNKARAAMEDPGQVAAITIEHLFGEAGFVIFGVLFWYLVAGIPGVVMFRAVHSLAGGWRGHAPGEMEFSRPVECLDWLLSWFPVRLVALTYLLLGRWRGARALWRDSRCRSGAERLSGVGIGALGLCSSVASGRHGGQNHDVAPRPCVAATESDIVLAVAMVEQGTWIWVGVAVILGAIL